MLLPSSQNQRKKGRLCARQMVVRTLWPNQPAFGGFHWPQPIATWSMVTFSKMEEVGEIVVVCAPEYRDIFEGVKLPRDVTVKFALPGKERQDSVESGLAEIAGNAELVAVHDSARPLVREQDVRACVEDAMEHGAAVLGVPVKVRHIVGRVPSVGPVCPHTRRSNSPAACLQASSCWAGCQSSNRYTTRHLTARAPAARP